MAVKKKLSIAFDSPVTLIFVILCLVIAIVREIWPELGAFFVCASKPGTPRAFNFKSITDYLGLFLYVFGDKNWVLLSSNLVFILLLGPKVEQVFGRLVYFLLLSVAICVSSVLCVCFSSEIISGSSGIVCLLLILAMYNSIDKLSIPLSYILLACLFFGREIINISEVDSLSVFYQFAGALVSSLIGILSVSTKTTRPTKTTKTTKSTKLKDNQEINLVI